MLPYLARSRRYYVRRPDVRIASLCVPVKDDVYVKQVPGFEQMNITTGGARVLKPRKCMYCARQSPRTWGGMFPKANKDVGLTATNSGMCVYVYVSGANYAVQRVCVDDVLLFRHCPAVVKDVQAKFVSNFSIRISTGDLVLSDGNPTDRRPYPHLPEELRAVCSGPINVP